MLSSIDCMYLEVALGLITEASLKSATQSATRLFDYCYKLVS